MLRTSLCDLLDIEYPIISAGMGWVARAELAAAVSNAGGLGVLGGNIFSPDELREEIRKTRRLTSKPFGVDLLLATAPKDGGTVAEQWTALVAGQIEVCLDEQVAVFASGIGNPGPAVPDLHRRGIKVMALVGNVRHARMVAAGGVDVVVAQGHEAGGHTGRIATMALVPQVVDAVKVPVVAAGGIADGRGLVAALVLGACGVWMGTRFVTTHEAYSHINYKNKILQATEEDTVVTRVYSGKPARNIKNRFIEAYDGEILPFPLQKAKIGDDVYWAARRDGNTDLGSMPAGQICGMITQLKSAKEVVEELMAEAERVLAEIHRR